MTLKELRTNAGLNTKDVAWKLDVSCAAVWYWEHGSNGIARKYRKKLAKLYGCTEEELIEAMEASKEGEHEDVQD